MTAVEWLTENIPDLGKYIPFGVSIELHGKFQQALELEKQQIENAFNAGVNSEDYYYPNSMFTESETYYNETYKKDNI